MKLKKHKTSQSLLQFRLSRKTISLEDSNQYNDPDQKEEYVAVFLYDDWVEIGVRHEGDYNLHIERSETNSPHLSIVESVLWDWYKGEMGIETLPEINGELHQVILL